MTPAGSDPILDIRGLTLTVGRKNHVQTVVEDVSLTVGRGEIVGLVGESGSGKTLTALSSIALQPPAVTVARGEIRLDGDDVRTLSRQDLRRHRGSTVGMIFQEPMTSLNPVLTIGDQVGESFRLNAGLSRAAARERTAEALDRVGIARPRETLDEYPHRLSGGMRQRVMIAMALAGDPKLLIADEPTTALDNSVQKQILELIVAATTDTGTSVLIVTHDLSVVSEVTDRVVVMESGRVVEDATVFDIFAAPQHRYTRELISLVPTDKRMTSAVPRSDSTAEIRGPLLEVLGVSKTYDVSRVSRRGEAAGPAVDNIDLIVRRGETVGLVGESGSGKSTLGKLITRLIRPDTGRILLDGEDLHTADRARLKVLRRNVSMVFQDPISSLNPRMRLGDIIAEPLVAQRIMNKKSRDRRVAELLDAVGLSGAFTGRLPHELSGGQRQRIGIARALATNPALIVCDEPVSALDMSIQGQILTLLRSLQPEFGVSYLFIAHGLDSVYEMSDRIAVMQAGRIVEVGSRDQVFHSPQEPYTRELLDARLSTEPAASRIRPDRARLSSLISTEERS